MQELVVAVDESQIPALFAPGGLDALLSQLDADARSIVPDVSTKKGRDTIRSTAAKIAKTKTYLDGLGKDLTANLKRQTAAVDVERKAMRDRLDALKDDVRRPLTEWEQAEESRVAGHRERIADLVHAASYSPESASSELSAALARIESVELGPQWEEFEAEAARAKDSAVATLRAAIETAKRREAEQAELVRLRAEAAERERQEREGRIAAEAAERAKAEAECIAREAAEEVERKAQAERLRAENERLQAERDRAEAERRAIEAEQHAKQAAEDAERRVQQAAEQERARAKAEAEHVAAETAKRAADREHRARINTEAATALVASAGVSLDQARAIVTAIARGAIPAVGISY
jgi:hypothetical protein